MQNEWERAFILHTRPYSETSLLLDVFSEQTGRQTLLAKGARRKSAPQKGFLRPFTPLLIRFSGKGNIKTLTQVEAVSLTLPLSGAALYSGLYVNELLSRTLLNHAQASALFFEYLLCLQQLSAASATEIEPPLRRFEFVLLDYLGFHVDFLHCAASGEPIADTMTYQYREELGFVASVMKIQNQQFFLGQELRAFSEKNFIEKSALAAAKRFTRLVLKPYIGVKPLKSRELFTYLSAAIIHEKNKE